MNRLKSDRSRRTSRATAAFALCTAAALHLSACAETNSASTPSSANDASQTTEQKNVLFVGDSITAGVCDGRRFTYREPLLEQLADEGFDFDTVGSRGSAEFPGDCYDFPDGEHVSYPGALTPDLGAELSASIGTFAAPDIALVLAGVNDLNRMQSPSQIVADLRGIVDTILERNPAAKIYIGRLFENDGYGPGVSALNAEIEVNFETEPNVYTVALDSVFMLGVHDSDGLHPNQRGAEVLARKWFERLVDTDAFGRTVSP